MLVFSCTTRSKTNKHLELNLIFDISVSPHFNQRLHKDEPSSNVRSHREIYVRHMLPITKCSASYIPKHLPLQKFPPSQFVRWAAFSASSILSSDLLDKLSPTRCHFEAPGLGSTPRGVLKSMLQHLAYTYLSVMAPFFFKNAHFVGNESRYTVIDSS